jgi:glycosyltransferase involved in cell wall biosynthesis
MNKIKVSIIIPVYNAEKYLRQCLHSVVNQTLKEIEIICVDDGSKDNSLEILEEYQKKDSRIIILQQENLHAGIARNNGLSAAKGEFVHFMDADDWIEQNAYEHWYEIAKEKNADMCYCFYTNFDDETGNVIEKRAKILKDAYISEGNLTENFDYFIHADVAPWNKIYRRDFLQSNHIQFDDLICVNDRSFYFWTILLAEKNVVVQEYWINHRKNNSASLVGSTRFKNFDCHFRSFETVWEIYKNCDDSIKRTLLHLSIADMLFWYRKSLGSDLEKSISNQLGEFLRKRDMSLFGVKIVDRYWYQEYLNLTGIEESPEIAFYRELQEKNKELEYLRKRLDNVLASKSYRVGRIVTFPMRKIFKKK